MAKKLNKIIYFDKETINNLLEESNQGSLERVSGTSSNSKISGDISIGGNISLTVPFFQRLGFLFSSKLDASYIKQKAKSVTVTSTEISEFEKLKKDIRCIKNIQIKDIENSSTFFRVAGGYLKILKGGVEEVDVKEFSTVMESYEGYDTYKVDSNRYIRFNNTAFVSNYRRNDLLTTRMTIYCISVGNFSVEEFDFLKQLNKMETLITGIESDETLADTFPLTDEKQDITEKKIEITPEVSKIPSEKNIELLDVLYASISQEDSNE